MALLLYLFRVVVFVVSFLSIIFFTTKSFFISCARCLLELMRKVNGFPFDRTVCASTRIHHDSLYTYILNLEISKTLFMRVLILYYFNTNSESNLNEKKNASTKDHRTPNGLCYVLCVHMWSFLYVLFLVCSTCNHEIWAHAAWRPTFSMKTPNFFGEPFFPNWNDFLFKSEKALFRLKYLHVYCSENH